jgi:hypothetical protein
MSACFGQLSSLDKSTALVKESLSPKDRMACRIAKEEVQSMCRIGGTLSCQPRSNVRRLWSLKLYHLKLNGNIRSVTN